METSPQSPLCGIGSWSGKSSGSSRGSPNDGSSLVSSPPSTPSLNCKDDAWDLLYAAAGQVVRMKLNDEVPNYGNNKGLLGVPQKSVVTNAGSYSNLPLTQQQLQANHFYQLKQQQQQQLQQCSSAWGRQVRPSSEPQQQQIPINNGRATGLVNGRCNSRPLGLPPSAWPPLQQQPHHHQQQQQNGSDLHKHIKNTDKAL